MVRDSRYKLVTYDGTGLGELFDLHTDPAEFHNRWHDPALVPCATPSSCKASTPSPCPPTSDHPKPPHTERC